MTVFRSRRRPEEQDAYFELLAAMEEEARRMPGFVDYKAFTSDDGERVSLITFVSAEAQRAWREEARHRAAQQRGRDEFYLEYSLQVGECTHVSQWVRTLE
jgi:heme-degrading monooxygenase HmoA